VLAGRSRSRRRFAAALAASDPTHIGACHSLRRNKAFAAKGLDQSKAENKVYLLGGSAGNPFSGFYRAAGEKTFPGEMTWQIGRRIQPSILHREWP
jgi:hypothetical protein